MAEQHDLLAAGGGRGPAERSRPTPVPDSASADTGDSLTIEQILAWADAHHAAHGAWPAVGPGTVLEFVGGKRGESSRAINYAFVFGLRGLPGDSSLAELLAAHRGVPLPDMGPKALAEKTRACGQEKFPVKRPRLRLKRSAAHQFRLTIEQILAWADAHHAATGKWPSADSGRVHVAPVELTWSGVNESLYYGRRGFPGGRRCTCSWPRIVSSGSRCRSIRSWRGPTPTSQHMAVGPMPTSGPRRRGPV
jgi:hypothetical protein